MLEPVAKRSSSSTKPNSADDQRIKSSQKRLKCIIKMASADRVSSRKSRSLTASRLLGVTCENPSSWARKARSSGNALPANAPEPTAESGPAAKRHPAAHGRAPASRTATARSGRKESAAPVVSECSRAAPRCGAARPTLRARLAGGGFEPEAMQSRPAGRAAHLR